MKDETTIMMKMVIAIIFMVFLIIGVLFLSCSSKAHTYSHRYQECNQLNN